MNIFLTAYHNISTKVKEIWNHSKLKDREHSKGRKPILSNSDLVSCAIFKQKHNIATKKALFEILEPSISYRKFVDGLNRVAKYLARIIIELLSLAREDSHLIKFTDSTDIPVCLNKNGKNHKTMKALASWSKTGKGSFYGLKLHLSADLNGKVLALKFTSGNGDDRKIFRKMNEKLRGLFVADAGYVSSKLERDFFIEGERALITSTRKNMKKISTSLQIAVLNLRMRVEVHFRVLKVCYGLVTSLPRSINGCLAHYLATVCAHLVA